MCGGGNTIATAPCTNIAIKAGNAQISLTWNDPDDGDAIWKETIVRYKAGSAPASINDGTIAVKETTRNQYATTPLVIDNLTNGTTYYISIFPKSTKGGINTDITQIVSATPKATSVWTVKIDQNNSNPLTCCTYADAAVGMEKGSSEWDEIFGYKPCVMKDGAVVGYLNPNDFTKYEDGSAAPITDSNYDVMIEFPRMGLNISTDSNDVISVSLTDDKNSGEFGYFAHRRGDVQKKYFYLGAYQASLSSDNKILSISSAWAEGDLTLKGFINQAHNRTTGYEIMGFYQWTYIQALYVLKYGNLNSQTAVGAGYVDGMVGKASGETNTKGMCYGSTSTSDSMKLFGLENLWGNQPQFICGITGSSLEIHTATDNFGTDNYEYTTKYNLSIDRGYITKVYGTNILGFFIEQAKGSSTTYFTDGGSRNTGGAQVGGRYSLAELSGIFYCTLNSKSAERAGSRLMYL